MLNAECTVREHGMMIGFHFAATAEELRWVDLQAMALEESPPERVAQFAAYVPPENAAERAEFWAACRLGIVAYLRDTGELGELLDDADSAG